MATFELTTPDGAVYHVDAPDEQSAVQALQQHTGGGGEQPAAPQAAPQAAPKDPSFIPNTTMDLTKGFVRGLRDPLDAGAEMLTHGLASGAGYLGLSNVAKYMKGQAAHVDALDKQAEADYQKTNPSGYSGAGRVAGSLLATLPLAGEIPATLPKALLTGLKQGAIQGALEPVAGKDNGSFWDTKLNQTVTGGLTGAGTAGVLAGAGRVISPMVSPAVKKLMAAGVKPTPGQILGGSFDRLEEAGTSIPFLGDSIRSARNRSVDSFNRAAIDDALSPIGAKLAPDTQVGRDAIQEAADKVAAHYDSVVPHSGMVADSTFTNNLANLRANAATMLPERARQFETILNNKVFQNFSHGGSLGHISGPRFKEAESEIGRLASSYRHSADADQRELGDALFGLQSELRQNLLRANPQAAPALQASNDAYSRLLRIQGAAATTGADGGVFSPAQFSASVRRLDPTLRKSAYAKGNAKMQELSDMAKEVLSDKVPNSGTPFRTAVQGGGLLAVLGSTGAVSPEAALTIASGIGGLSAAYSKTGQTVLRALLAQRPAQAARAARVLRSLQLPRAVAASSTQP